MAIAPSRLLQLGSHPQDEDRGERNSLHGSTSVDKYILIGQEGRVGRGNVHVPNLNGSMLCRYVHLEKSVIQCSHVQQLTYIKE